MSAFLEKRSIGIADHFGLIPKFLVFYFCSLQWYRDIFWLWWKLFFNKKISCIKFSKIIWALINYFFYSFCWAYSTLSEREKLSSDLRSCLIMVRLTTLLHKSLGPYSLCKVVCCKNIWDLFVYLMLRCVEFMSEFWNLSRWQFVQFDSLLSSIKIKV